MSQILLLLKEAGSYNIPIEEASSIGIFNEGGGYEGTFDKD